LRIDERPTADGGSPEQHTESHIVAARKGDFDGPLLRSDLDQCLDHIPDFLVAPGIGHDSTVDDRRFAADFELAVALLRMHPERHPRRIVLLKLFDAKCMQRRSAGTRVDLRFDALYAELGQANTLTPSECQHIASAKRRYAQAQVAGMTERR
jgi:hypothetical protein